jgi:hypothetical protein
MIWLLARFFGGLGGFIEAAAKAGKPAKPEQPRVAAFGEAVDLLQAQGKPDAAIRLERAAASLFASWRRSASGSANSEVPQSKQTTISGNTHTTGLLIFFSSGKMDGHLPAEFLLVD